MKKNILLVLIFFCMKDLYAQRTPSSSVAFKSSIKQLIINSEKGITYVKETDKISAYANDLNKVIWELDKESIGANSVLTKLAEIDITAIGKDNDQVEIIENSNYIFANINGMC